MVPQPRVGSARILRLVSDPLDRVYGVVVRRRETVLRRKAVVDGDDDGWKTRGQGNAGVVEDGGGRVVEDESAAVEVDDNGEFGRRGRGRVREE